MHTLAGIALLLGLCVDSARAQIDTAPRFDAASIKPSAPGSHPLTKAHPGGRLEISRATLRTLAALAYRLPPFQVTGGSAWVRSEHFDINTKATENPTEDRLLLMMRSLLAERFSLTVHFETKEQPVYLLVAANSGKRTPPGLHVTTEGSCAKVDHTAPPDPKACGALGMGLGHLEAQEISMTRLADALSRVLDRKVIDRTDRNEKFNVSFHWSPDEHPPQPGDVVRSHSPQIPHLFFPRYTNSSA